jgi:hypothetical protein
MTRPQLIQEESVRRNLNTTRASGNFRNYWHYHLNEFHEFRMFVRDTWSGMDIQWPELDMTGAAPCLFMFCSENRIDRELYWAGFGFQVWCQLLTHIQRARTATLLVVDEPEIYLHPDLQRQLLSILRGVRGDVLLATHSAEIAAEAEPSDLLLVDKSKRATHRVHDSAGVVSALDALGSRFNFSLTQIARTKKILFVEGTEYGILKRFAMNLGLGGLAAAIDFAILPMEGFPPIQQVRGVCEGIRDAVGQDVKFAAVFDRDYRADAWVDHFQEDMAGIGVQCFVPARKETENYLLISSALRRTVDAEVENQSKRGGRRTPPPPDLDSILEDITNDWFTECLSRYQHRALEAAKALHRPVADTTVLQAAADSFKERWEGLDTRLELVPGKRTFARFNSALQELCGASLSKYTVAESVRPEEIPSELVGILRLLEKFSRSV